ncbi:MAG: hypothetical protein LBV70_07470 [Candidatus Adiutrix sp.]|jgi:hypothetical protein|nr:hypothetical protein [Candidatus Adiutrix sp.]
MTRLEISELSNLSNILAIGLAAVPERPLALPLEVSQALDMARAQVTSLPEVISNLNLAAERFRSLASALTGMMDLAEQAAAETVSDYERQRLDAEFINLAKVVAAEVGRQNYQGPSLNLRSRGEALSAAKIVRYMAPAIENLGRDLAEQKGLIQDVIAETINFLDTVAQSYPEADPTLNILAEATRPYRPLVSPALLH